MPVSARAAGLAGPALMIAIAIALMAVALLAVGPTRGADHRDSPGVEDDAPADITDVYAFRSPEDPDNLVAVLNVNGLTAPPENAAGNFATDVTYNLHIDNTGDLVADATASITFSGDPLMFTVEGLGEPITGEVTPPSTDPTPPEPMVTEANGIKVFAGQRDDPFFFDLVGFKAFVAGPYVPAEGLRAEGETPAADTFAGTNVSSIVIELPVTALTGEATSDTGVIRAWATTSRAGSQVDRMAIPAINTAVIPSDQKDAFNQADPANDAADFGAAAQTTIEGLRTAVNGVLDAAVGPEDGGPLGSLTAEQVKDAVIPDVVTIDFSQPVGFTNGRTLEDDVIDVALQLVLNRTAGITDAIDANDVAFSSTFPYLADPHQPEAQPTATATPSPEATATPQLPTAGTAPGEDGGLSWTFIVVVGLGGLLAAAGTALLLRRRAIG
ncbi:MAG: DUF4331 family protein [Dehalococcoidia bacterium]